MLAIVPADSCTAQLVARHQLGWTHPQDDIAGIAASLRLALQGQVPTPCAVAELHVSAVMGRYEALLRRLLHVPAR